MPILSSLVEPEVITFTCWYTKFFEAEWRINVPVNQAIIGLDNDTSPIQRQAVIWRNAGLGYN